jgi:antitoxin HicB
MEKNLEYYMKLPYTITITPEEDNDGSPVYIARILEIPHILGDGKTESEAIKTLKIHLGLVIKTHLEKGCPIPEPQKDYSGNINIRIDPELHARLAREAAAYDMSLNKYTSLILERRQSSMNIKKPAMVRERKRRYNTKK